MENRFYPVFINGAFLRCLIVGGGNVGERKAETLCDVGAKVVLVSPRITPRLTGLARKNRIRWIPGVYETQYLMAHAVQLVIGATDDPEVNARVFYDAKNAGIPVNIVDDPDHCTFIVPSVFSKGSLAVAVSTGGAAPKLAARIRREIQESVPDEYEAMIDELGGLRPFIRKFSPRVKERFWQTIFAVDVTVYAGKQGELRRIIRSEFERHRAMCKDNGDMT